MSNPDLRSEVLGLLTDVRAAGRNASPATLDSLLDRRLPALVAAQDPYEASNLSVVFKTRLTSAVSSACAEVREAGPAAGSSGSGSLIARLFGSGIPSRRRTAVRRWALAGAAVLILLAVMLYSVRRPKDHGIVKREKPGVTTPDRVSPLPKTRRDKLNIVDKAPQPRRGPGPAPAPNERERVVVKKQPIVGTFAHAEGDPVILPYPGGKPTRVSEGAKIARGSIIDTGDMGKVEIKQNDGSIIGLGFNTKVRLAAFDTLSRRAGGGSGLALSRDFELLSGTFDAKVARTKDLDQFIVRTPVATARVMGTEFSITLEKRAKLRAVLQVKSGRVAFYNDHGRVEAPERTESTVVQGSGPTEPKRIPKLAVFTFDWSKVRRGLEVGNAPTNPVDAAISSVLPGGWTGLSAAPRNGDVRIYRVLDYSPAQDAGLRVGDVILALNGRPISSAWPIHQASFGTVRQTLRLTIRRNGAEMEVPMRGITRTPTRPTVPRRLLRPLFDSTWMAIAGQPAASIKRLETLAAQTPHAAVHNNIGIAWSLLDRMGPAIRSFQTAVRLDGKSPLYRRNLGRALGKIGNFPRALEEFEAAFATDPQDHEAILDLGNTYLLVDPGEKALALLTAAQTRLPRCPHIATLRAQILMRAGRPQDAVEAAIDATRRNPDDAETHFILGIVLAFSGRHAEAEDAYRRAIELTPDRPHVHNNRATNLEDWGRQPEAEAAFREAIRLDPNLVTARDGLGRILFLTGRLPEAEDEQRKLVELEPRNAMYRARLGDVLKQLNRLPEAEAEFRMSIRLDPNFADSRVTLGWILLNTGRLPEAEAITRSAIRLAPKNAIGHGNLGFILRDLGRLPEAETAFRNAIALDPKQLESRVQLGRILGRLGRFQEVPALYAAGIKVDPRNADLFGWLGWSQIENHRWKEAVESLRQCIAIGASDDLKLNALSNIGFALIRLGEIGRAEETLAEALKLNPDYRDASLTWALLLATKGTNLDEALDRAKRIAEQPNADGQALEVLGFVHFKRGELEPAIEALNRAAARYGKVYLAADALVTLGQVYEAKKETPSAIDAYRGALKIEPGNRPAADALKRLRP